MMSITRNSWFIPAALISLSAIPIIAGSLRLAQVMSGSTTSDNLRFVSDPWPAWIHIVSAAIYSVLGAFQFSPALRKRQARWHRQAGTILLPLGLVTALSGLWLTLVYPRVGHDGSVLFGLRILVGLAMTLFLVLGIEAIRRRNFSAHGAWMIRSYALGLGAGTQALTHLPWLLFPSIQGEFSRTLFMGLGWAINMVLAEWIILRHTR